jgi:hypothetical protein
MPALLDWTREDGEIEVVTFDTFDSEDWDQPCEVSEFPVELAPGMTDQIILKPLTCTLVGYISEKPLATNDAEGAYRTKTLDIPGSPKYVQYSKKLDIPGSKLKPNVASLVTAGFNALTGAGGVEAQVRKRQGGTKPKQDVRAWSYDNYESRVVWTLNALEQARYERVLIGVVADQKQAEGMVIEGLQLHRTVEEGAGALFTLQLRQIQIAETETVAAPKPAENIAQSRKSKGSAATEKSGADEVAKLRSVLAGGLSGLGVSF